MDRPEDRVALIECLERDGRTARVLPVLAWPLSIGRAIDNHLVLDDPFVAAHHLRLEADDDGAESVAVLQTDNGAVLDGQRLRRGARAALPAGGAMLQIGSLRLRVRLRGETLPAERPLPALGARPNLAPLLGGLALMTLALAEHAIGLDPGADATAWLPVLAGLPVALAGWCGLWALLSKVFQHRFDFSGHLRIALPWMLAMQLAETGVKHLGAALGWPWLWHAAVPLLALLVVLWLHAHLAHLLPLHRRAVTTVVAVLALGGSAIALSHIQRSTDRWTRAPYMSTLPLPALDATRPFPPATLVQQMAPLAQILAERVQDARKDEAESGDDNVSGE